MREPRVVPGRKEELGLYCEMDGWRDGRIDGWRDSHVRVEINLFFPELALLLDSGHSHTG